MTYQYKTQPYSHQERVFTETRDLAAFALLWEQGTGKTKPTIDTAAHLWQRGQIDAVLVVAPSGVHRNWMTDELPVHLPDEAMAASRQMVWRTVKAGTKWHAREFDQLINHKGLAWLFISYDGFMTKRGKDAVWRFLKRRRVFYIVDEGHHIKTPRAKRTKSVVASGKYADYRRLLTGTPGDKPFDIYSQLKFIDPDIWRRQGLSTFAAFKQHYGVWRTAREVLAEQGYDPGYDLLLGYKNLEELRTLLGSMSDRVLKEDVLDLPDKLYTKLYFDMTPRQRSLYETLRDELLLELESGAKIDGSLAIVRLLRLQQITCGYMVTDAEEPVELCDSRNPRLDMTVDYLRELPHQAIVWCRFRHDVDQLTAALGERAVRYDGAVDEEGAARNKDIFNAGDADWLIGNTAKGSEGTTMVGAKTVFYYSNTFRYIQRMQSEDRAHRIGQEGAQHESHGHGVLYVDVCAVDTVDEQIIKSLRGKHDIASQITGDELRAWL